MKWKLFCFLLVNYQKYLYSEINEFNLTETNERSFVPHSHIISLMGPLTIDAMSYEWNMCIGILHLESAINEKKIVIFTHDRNGVSTAMKPTKPIYYHTQNDEWQFSVGTPCTDVKPWMITWDRPWEDFKIAIPIKFNSRIKYCCIQIQLRYLIWFIIIFMLWINELLNLVHLLHETNTNICKVNRNQDQQIRTG